MDENERNMAIRTRVNQVNRELAEALKHLRSARGLIGQLDLFLGSFGLEWDQLRSLPEVKLEVESASRYLDLLKREI